jgi:hypothetical protein
VFEASVTGFSVSSFPCCVLSLLAPAAGVPFMFVRFSSVFVSSSQLLLTHVYWNYVLFFSLMKRQGAAVVRQRKYIN